MDCTSHTLFTENMRRMFYTWLAAARKVRHKRVTLQEREYEMQKIRLENAWDKWRGRFQGEKLLPLVGVYLPCASPRRMMRKTGLMIDGRY
jgi:protein SFI1